MTHRGVVLDLDGTVYRGREALPGAVQAIETFQDAGMDLLLFSNNPTETRAAYVDRLAEMDIDVGTDEVVSAGTVTTRYLAENHVDDAVFLVGAPGLREQLQAADLSLTGNPEATDVLVASWSQTFDYDTMTDALHALADDGAVFVGSDPDRVVPTHDGGTMPGSGAIIGAVAAAVGRDPDRVLGKPSPEAVDVAREELSVPLEDCLLVGDRLNTDIALGERAGMTTVLVRTGVSGDEDVEDSDVTPDHVLDSLADVPDLLS